MSRKPEIEKIIVPPISKEMQEYLIERERKEQIKIANFSIRDLFAAVAMYGLLNSRSACLIDKGKEAYKIADEMMKARDKE